MRSALTQVEELLGILTPTEKRLLGRCFNCIASAGAADEVAYTWLETYKILEFGTEDSERYVKFELTVRGGTLAYSKRAFEDLMTGPTFHSSRKTKSLLTSWIAQS